MYRIAANLDKIKIDLFTFSGNNEPGLENPFASTLLNQCHWQNTIEYLKAAKMSEEIYIQISTSLNC